MKHIKMTATAIATVMALNSAAQAQMLTILAGDTPDTIANIEALVAAFGEKNPDVSFDVEFRPGGADGDNIIKSRLATGEMADVFTYNTGSLFQAIRPDRNLMPITQEDMLNRVLDSFEATVTSPDGDIFGVPFGAAMGGGIFYNRGIYDELGLEVPRSWDEFMSNNAKIAEAGKVPVAQTYGDTWTSQLSFWLITTMFKPQNRISPSGTQPIRRSTRNPRRQCAASSICKMSMRRGT